nr:hypothetical protein [Paenibacillus alvei]
MDYVMAPHSNSIGALLYHMAADSMCLRMKLITAGR